jgi:hypothetical protein
MNKIANSLFMNDDGFKKEIEQFARKQFHRRKSAYASESIFDVEDLEQELWCAMLESEFSSASQLREYVEEYAEVIARRGDRKNEKAFGPVEIPISQLPDDQRFAMENLFYAGSSIEDE